MNYIDESLKNIVRADVPYTYDMLVKDIYRLKKNHPFLKVSTIGRSVLGKKIFAVTLGCGKNEVFYNAAHHACEWITSVVLMRFIEDFARHTASGELFCGFDTRAIYFNSTIKIVPMVNPDGVNLSILGLTEESEEFNSQLTKWNGESVDFTHWSANIRGVDLNHNYDAGWEISKIQEPKYDVFGPGPSKYSGEAPESEPESKALARFTRAHDFRLVIAYHSQGEVIYWDFAEKSPEESLCIAEKFARASGYEIAGIAPGSAAVGGYKDWFVDKFNRPGFTVEVGLGVNPLPLSQFSKIYQKNIEMLLLGSIV